MTSISFSTRPRDRKGAALLLVLAMVFLLTGIVAMFLSWAMSQRQVSASSANQTKVELFTRGALDIIVSGLKQEIANGSTATTNNGVVVYAPTNNAYMMPVQGILNKSDAIVSPPTSSQKSLMPTLIRESGSGDTATIPAPAVPSYASACNSTTNVSYNNRNISLPRWNAHYLLQRFNSSATPSTTYDDRVPLSSVPKGTFNPNTANVFGNGAFMPPDWVFVTREEGPAVLNTPTTDSTGKTVTAIGRYAYAIYDEGGLLDMNAAGYPCNPLTAAYGNTLPLAAHTVPSPYAAKGALAFADLLQLTDGSGNSLMTQACINDLVGWRNYASMQSFSTNAAPTGSFPSLLFASANASSSYTNLIFNATNGPGTTGFTKVGSYTSGGRTDQAFLSRQEMINFFLAINANKNSDFNPTALQYLGTFSRAVNAPSWRPTADASSIANPAGTVDGTTNRTPTLTGTNGSPAIYAYKSNAEVSTGSPFSAAGTSPGPNPNRDIPNVRFANAATITHYDDSGNPVLYSVNAGDPLIQRRFSLAKLAWLTYNGTPPTGISAQNIQSCFGLQWNSSSYASGQPYWRWEYVGSTAAQTTPPTPLTRIETLGEVASENREPNFFELLKAGILSGSLGRDPGPGMDTAVKGFMGAGGVGVYSSFYVPPSAPTYNYKNSTDLQILQIGANLIDQADSDSYPTAIHLAPPSLTPADEVAINTVYGDENLPSIHAVVAIALADPLPTGTTIMTTNTPPKPTGYVTPPYGSLNEWLEPFLWNPHQVPTSSLSTGGYPTEFRAHAYGEVYSAWTVSTIDGGSGLTQQLNSTETIYDDGTGYEATPGHRGDIYFTNPADSTSPFYNNPTGLALTGLSPAAVDTNNTPIINTYNNDPTQYGTDDAASGSTTNKFAGFSLVPDTSYKPDQAHDSMSLDVVPDVASPLYLSLQYLGTDGYYHPYNFWARVTQSNANGKQFHTGDNIKIFGNSSIAGWGPEKMDARTDRFSASNMWWGKLGDAPNSTMTSAPQGGGYAFGGDYCIPYLMNAFTYTPYYNPLDMYTPSNPADNLAGTVPPPLYDWLRNDPAYGGTANGFPYNSYYADRDGVVRDADGYRMNTTSGDGYELLHGNVVVTPVSTITTPNTTASPPGSAQARRPAILNRPFRSVGELGFAYRDEPFKTLDFWTANSGDAALLDLFSVSDEPTVVAGVFNPNSLFVTTAASSSVPSLRNVLQAILAGAAKSDALGVQISGNDVNNSDAALLAGTSGTGAGGIATELSTGGLYWNRADLATRLGYLVSDPHNGSKVFDTQSVSSPASARNWGNKAYAEAPIRALADVTNTRTWNLMIDIVAQTGMFAPNASALGSSFIVQGERHYWLHIAIDRFTGKVVDQKLETVYE